MSRRVIEVFPENALPAQQSSFEKVFHNIKSRLLKGNVPNQNHQIKFLSFDSIFLGDIPTVETNALDHLKSYGRA